MTSTVEAWHTEDRRCVLVLAPDGTVSAVRLFDGDAIVLREEPLSTPDDGAVTALQWFDEEISARAAV